MDDIIPLRSYINGLLLTVGVAVKDVNAILSDANMKEFMAAFTHPSFSKKNYELYEFRGDVVVNEFVPFYLKEKFPKIISVKWINRMKHNLVGGTQLTVLAKKAGMEKFARYRNVLEYDKMMEDIFEAFFGCLTVITFKIFGSYAITTEICTRILKNFYDKEQIIVSYETVFDGVSRLKELYESKEIGLGWKSEIAYEKKMQGKVTIFKVYGWPKGDRSFSPENKVLLAEYKHEEAKIAKERASDLAVKVLKDKYGIEDRQPGPY